MALGERAGHRIYSERHGSGVRRGVFIHGALAHSGIWRGVIDDLPLSAITFDLPGHGRSGDWQGGDYHADCTAIARSFCDGPTDLIGHSFGATVALRLAVEHPALCRTLTLIEPVFFAVARADAAPELAAHDAGFAPVRDALAAGDRQTAARLFTAIWGDGRGWGDLPEKQRAVMAALMRFIPAGAAGHDRDGAGLLQPGRLARLTMPLRLVRGDQSPPIIAACHRGLLARMSGADERVIAGAGHMLPLTHPGAVAETLLTEAR